MKKISKYEILLIYTVIRKILELHIKFSNSYFIIELATFGLLFVMIVSDIRKSKLMVNKNDAILFAIMLLGEVAGFMYSFFQVIYLTFSFIGLLNL